MKLRSAILAAVLGWTSFAHADTPPSVWERAKEPDLADEYAVHESAIARMHNEEYPEGSAAASWRDAQLRGVIAMLQAAGAEKSKNPLLRFDLAYAYELAGETLHILGFNARAAALYKSALADFPDYSDADDAWSMLGQACAHVGDRECELKSWHEVLRRRTEDEARLTPTLNLAEVEMHGGDLKTAIDGYRDAIATAARIPGEWETTILAEWGLAVALDRAGEINEGEAAGRLALEMVRNSQQPGLLHSNHVYFVPEYEVHWYEAIAWAGTAETATTLGMRAELWRSAEEAMKKYVDAGEPAKDRWLPIAKARLARYSANYLKAKLEVSAELRLHPPLDPAPNFNLGPAPQVHNPSSGSLILHL